MRDPDLTARAKAMRREATEPELRLWHVLRARRFGNVKFRYQKVIGPYIADFSAREPMIVIEIDGDTHADRRRYDERRTKFMENKGYRVIRFSNRDVMEDLEGVTSVIFAIIATPPLPTLSRDGERAL